MTIRIVGPVMAMARPPRPVRERLAVHQAASALTCPNAKAKAVEIARQVAADAVAYLDADPVEQRLGDLEAALSPSPVATLARCPEIDAVGMIGKRRAARFEARGWQQIGRSEWEAETRAITAEVSAILAERYRKFLA